MGARDFSTSFITHDLASSFRNMVQEEREQHGYNDGYSFNKTQLKEVVAPDIKTMKQASRFIDELYNNERHGCNDKWSPFAYYIKLPKKIKVPVVETIVLQRPKGAIKEKIVKKDGYQYIIFCTIPE